MNELNKKAVRLEQAQRLLAVMMCFALILIAGMSATMGVALCENGKNAAEEATDTITTALEGTADQVYTVMKNAIMPCAGLAFAVAAFRLVFGGERGMSAAFKIAGFACGGIAMVFLAPLLVKAFGGWFVDSAGDMSSVNDLFGS